MSAASKPYICDCWHLPTNSLTNVDELVGNCQQVGRQLPATGGMKSRGCGHENGSGWWLKCCLRVGGRSTSEAVEALAQLPLQVVGSGQAKLATHVGPRPHGCAAVCRGMPTGSPRTVSGLCCSRWRSRLRATSPLKPNGRRNTTCRREPSNWPSCASSVKNTTSK